MSALGLKLRAALALGAASVWRAGVYRIGVRTGLNRVRRLRAAIPDGDFFTGAARPAVPARPAAPCWPEGARYFGWFRPARAGVPDWHANPFNGRAVGQAQRPWWRISDFDEGVGDIKTVWEASRLDWALAFAQHAANGDDAALAQLNRWLADWVRHNRPYCGPNWKCGQEASIRVMHLAVCALILGEHARPSAAMLGLLEAHLRRIEPTLSYAIAQDNNHGTSEAAALFIGGSWLQAQGVAAGRRWQALGRKWLENRAARLIERDGSFSQYSLTYHRVMLDTYAMAECWRRRLALAPFSARLHGRLQAAAQWLYQLTDGGNGDAPNLGANDGARLLPLCDSDYRDFRPCVQLAMALFCARRAYPDGRWNGALQWLGVALPAAAADAPASAHFPDGGYAALRCGGRFALLRYPRFRFRPSQADALHVDLWSGGDNLLRDAGTYSYNDGAEALRYFGGTASHNTVQFDDADQMPRIGKFLFGDWLRSHSVAAPAEAHGVVTAAAGYTSRRGARHVRALALSARALRVDDEIAGFARSAVLRWRLAPGQWRVQGDSVVGPGGQSLRIGASMPIVRMEIVEGREARYYMKQTPLPVLEVAFAAPGSVTTTYEFTP